MAFFINIHGVQEAFGACRVACLLLLVTGLLAGSPQVFAQLSVIAGQGKATEPVVDADPVEINVFSDSLNRQTPRSSAGEMYSAFVTDGRIIGAVPESSAARIRCSRFSRVSYPCSASSRTKS